MVVGAVHGALCRICRDPRRKSRRCRPPAPISSRSATTSGTTRAARSPRSPRPSTPARAGAGAHEWHAATWCSSCARDNRRAARNRLPRTATRCLAGRAGSRLRRIPARPLRLGAFKEATRRVEEKNDPKAMTLLGELYADGLGVPNDDKKAAEWYKLAAARGDREAMFALAMFKMTGRGGPADRPEAVRLLTEAAKLGHVVAAYDLALLYLEGQLVPQDFNRAAELMRQRRRCRQSAGAIRAGHLLQGRPRREEGPGGGRPSARRRGARRPHRCRGRIRHRAVQRHRRRQEREPPPPTISSRRRRRAMRPARTGWR